MIQVENATVRERLRETERDGEGEQQEAWQCVGGRVVEKATLQREATLLSVTRARSSLMADDFAKC